MKISLDWISDFVDISDIDPETIADRLTLATAEVEGFELLNRSIDGVVIGEVVSVEPLAVGGVALAEPVARGGGALRLATVDCGPARWQTVCGAPNLHLGMKTAFAPPGVSLAGGLRIKASDVGGQKSEGVLCSAKELGMSGWHEIVLECPAALRSGTPLADFIPASDVIIEIDNKSLTHRPDLWGHYAFARELAAIFGRRLGPLPTVDLARWDDLPPYPLNVDDTEGCPCYGCIEFETSGTAEPWSAVPSPLVVQRRLHALGQRTYNLLVDLTNYVMLELGQPTHAFDGERLKGVRVAAMGRKGTFVTLDGQQRQMLPDDLLIWNEKEPVALAGVMGGLNSEVQETTSKVLLESANFKGSRVRRTSVRLDLRTESAQRFEKNQPPANVKLAAARILRLIEDAGRPYTVSSRFTVAGDLKDRFRPLELAPGSLDAMAGTELPREKVVSILGSLGFQAKYHDDGRLSVGVPPHRSEADISIAPDIAEEVLRVYGYDKIEPKLPSAPLEPLFIDRPLRLEHKIRRLLAASHGFVEVHNYAWTDDQWLAQIGFQPAEPLSLQNPITQTARLLRTTLIPNMLTLVSRNRAHRDRFRMFEIGHVYSSCPDGRCRETTNLAGISFQQAGQPGLEEHFRAIKGCIEDLARLLGSRFSFEGGKGDSPHLCEAPSGPSRQMGTVPFSSPWQSAGNWVAISQGDHAVGTLGVLAGPIIETVSPEGGQVVWFELATGALEGSIYPQVKYAAPPIYPGSWQDFSLVWDTGRGFAALEERLAGFSHPLVMHRDFLYSYKGKGLPSGKASYSFRYWLGAWDRTLTSEQIDEFRDALLAFLRKEEVPLR